MAEDNDASGGVRVLKLKFKRYRAIGASMAALLVPAALALMPATASASTIVNVPEPGTLSLIMMGLAGVSLVRRRKS